MKWHQRPATKLILRTTKYTMLCLTLYLFLQEMAFFVSRETTYSYENTVGDYLRESIRVLSGTAFAVTMIGGPLGLVVGSVAAAALAPSFRGSIGPRSVRFILGFVTSLALIPVIHHYPGFLLALEGDKSRLIGLLAIIPMGLALRWSQIVAGKYISETARSETSAAPMRPHDRMILRTFSYSVAVGVPLMTAYVCLYVTVARTWIYNDPIFLLLMCLAMGSIGFTFLGGIIGAFLATMTKFARGRRIDDTRFRIMVSLVPLLIIALLLLSMPPDYLERFWWKLQAGNYLAKLDAAGWLLAAATGVGICQIVAAKYQREVSPPKNDRPLVLWRPIPLITIIALIVVCSVAISVCSHTIYLSQIELEPASRMSEAERLLRAGRDGVSVGLIFGSAIALTIMLRFSQIRRLVAYRFTILVIALVIAATQWGHNTLNALSQLLQAPDQVWRTVLLLAEVSLVIVTTVLSAELYLRTVTASSSKQTVSKLNRSVD